MQMKDQHGFYQDERRDTLPDPGAKSRANGDLKGREMPSMNDGATRAVIYIRVASAESGSEQQVKWQEIACREVARRLGFMLVAVYSDIGTAQHPELRRMLDELESTKARYAIAVDPSRFGRRVSENVAVRAALAAAGVELVFVQGASREPLALPREALSETAVVAITSEGGVR